MDKIIGEKIVSASRQKLRKVEILRGRQAFKDILAGGTRLVGIHLRVYLLPVSAELNHGIPIRVGFAVSGRVKSAAVRNRVRRLMREAYRRNRGILSKPLFEESRYYALILMYRGEKSNDLMRVSYREIEEDLRNTLEKALGSR